MHTLTLALDGDEWSASRPGCFTPRERDSGTHRIEGYVAPRATLDTMSKRKIPSPCKGSNPDHPIVQPMVSHYTDSAIPALHYHKLTY